MTILTRFAPSPTGQIHVGNARTALFCWLFAKAVGGQFMLRLDDTDLERSTEDFAKGIIADMAWLGLLHDITAKQSDRFDKYRAAFGALREQGLLYACYETPEELERKRKRQLSRRLPPVYDRAALELTVKQIALYEKEGRQPHWRFKLSSDTVAWNDVVRGEQKIDTASLSDPVLVRGDGTFLYTLPSVVDDIEFGVSHIIRGEDHVTNTATQIEIFDALNATPPLFAHHPLLVMADGAALSKRLGSLSIAALREAGLDPMAINSLIARLGTPMPVEPQREMERIIAGFDLDRLGRAPAHFDLAELERVNAKLLHDAPYAEMAERLAEMNIGGGEDFWLAVRGNLTHLAEASDLWRIVDGQIAPIIAVEDKDYIVQALAALPPAPWSEDTWGAWTSALKKSTGRKGKSLFMPLRQALTGQAHGPEMQKLLLLIGPERAKKRLEG